MFDDLTQLVADASAWAYVVLLLVAAFDALVPLVPSETAVITAGVLAAAGDLALPVVIGAAALGAFAGDNGAYALGRRYGGRVARRLATSRRASRRLAWAERRLGERGGELIAVGRFIPGGRTAVTLTAGSLHFPWPRFLVLDAAAGLGWALYAALLGFFGGEAFEHAPWKGLALALGVALALVAVVELVRLLRRRRLES